MTVFQSTKTYGNDLGLSCCFRQHRAEHSHCSKLHGYSIGVKLVFQATQLDDLNWVMDFGGLKDIKKFLTDHFDHKTLVAEDDPLLDELTGLSGLGAADVIVLPAVGCERFAEFIGDYVTTWLARNNHSPRVSLASVEVFEHGANSAIICYN